LRAAAVYVTVCNVTKRNNLDHPLTRLQQAVLDFVSARGSATAEQIRTGLHTRHPLSDSAMRTILRRLEARDLVSHSLEGKAFLYRTEVPSTRVAAAAVQRLIKNFWAGSAERFLTGLVDEDVLSAAELRRLARKVKARK
jgi:predicted transcriptional regulator